MRMSQRFGKTLREIPAEADLPSHSLMLRAALISRVAAGIYNYMPFAWRSIRKIEDIMRREMDRIMGQELNMPVVHPAELWKESGRWYSVGPELVRMKDRSGRDMVLAMTHEETVTDLARRYIDSYKQLPLVVYHIQTKFRDEPRSRAGLIRVREFIMKDAYSFHSNERGLDEYYPLMCEAYLRICKSCGVPAVQVLGEVGMMGGTGAHEFTYLTEYGEDTLLLCPKCGYAANRDTATIDKNYTPKEDGQEVPPISKVATPGMNTIALVGEFLSVDPRETIKTMVYMAKDNAVMVVIRGDLDVNENKLANHLKVSEIRFAERDELESLGLVQGYMSPVGICGMKVVSDDSLLDTRGYVAGANEKDFHLKCVVPGRDFQVDLTADIAAAREGDLCLTCGENLTLRRGVEIGNTFKLGTRYSKSMGANFQDQDGSLKPLVMGCYGMGVGRLLACIVQENHDERGIVWPMSVTPYHVHMVSLATSDKVRNVAEDIYARLGKRGVEVLYDDRDESAGVKFNDADLLGMPIRLTISERSLKQGGVEVKLRRDDDSRIVGLEELDETIRQIIDREMSTYAPEEV
ncbi:MAG: proline--tRNA ligase [Bacillota bacterium]|jgi:prolyl-tRNA synthetase